MPFVLMQNDYPIGVAKTEEIVNKHKLQKMNEWEKQKIDGFIYFHVEEVEELT